MGKRPGLYISGLRWFHFRSQRRCSAFNANIYTRHKTDTFIALNLKTMHKENSVRLKEWKECRSGAFGLNCRDIHVAEQLLPHGQNVNTELTLGNRLR